VDILSTEYAEWTTCSALYPTGNDVSSKFEMKLNGLQIPFPISKVSNNFNELMNKISSYNI